MTSAKVLSSSAERSSRSESYSNDTISNDTISNDTKLLSRPFRWSILLAIVTFPLIWVGGLVTTTDAGMAVPDWPNTYGYNLFLYPFATWFFGPWDLFIEHGHRLLGSLAGLVAIGLLISTFRNTRLKSLRMLSFGALLLVVFQGVLGGIRVLESDRVLAKIHGCLGPAFFAYVAGMATYLYQLRSRSADQITKPGSPSSTAVPRVLPWLVGSLVIASFIQLILGASLRHIDESESFLVFRDLLWGHILFATLVFALTMASAGVVTFSSSGRYRSIAWLIGIIVATQVLLGIATWVTKYHWPFSGLAGYTIVDKSMLQTSVVTAHVALGSLVLMLSTVWATRVFLSDREGIELNVTSKVAGMNA